MDPSKKIDQVLRILGSVRDARPANMTTVEAARKRATKQVAIADDIDERTVADKCWRGLWLSDKENFHIADFDRLVEAWLLRRDGGLRARVEASVGHANEAADKAAIAKFFGGGEPPKPPPATATHRGRAIVDHVTGALRDEGLHFTRDQVADFYLCLRTKPFVLFAGISGTGKSILARRFAECCGFDAACRLVPVRPDWSDPGELMGYRNLHDQFVPGHLVEALVAAAEDISRPFFLVLDEMNLARVEHYFADVLSIMETRKRSSEDDTIVTKPLLRLPREQAIAGDGELADRLRRLLTAGSGELGLPANLVVVGTVNMDESTHPFSRKVLDRAMTMEFGDVDLRQVNPPSQEPRQAIAVSAADLSANHLSLAEVWEGRVDRFEPALDLLVRMNEPLARTGLQVGYRVRDEVCLYVHHNSEQELLDPTHALDLALHHKVLPRIRGGDEVEQTLRELLGIAQGARLGRCAAKIQEMQRRLGDAGGYTSFWS